MGVQSRSHASRRSCANNTLSRSKVRRVLTGSPLFHPRLRAYLPSRVHPVLNKNCFVLSWSSQCRVVFLECYCKQSSRIYREFAPRRTHPCRLISRLRFTLLHSLPSSTVSICAASASRLLLPPPCTPWRQTPLGTATRPPQRRSTARTCAGTSASVAPASPSRCGLLCLRSDFVGHDKRAFS